MERRAQKQMRLMLWLTAVAAIAAVVAAVPVVVPWLR